MIKKISALIKGGMIEGIAFRASYIISFLSSIMYFIVIYSLWKAIYSSSLEDKVHGMTFEETILYLVLATALGSFIEIQLVWEMESKFQSGKIIFDITKPMSFPKYLFFEMFGRRVDYFIAVFVPIFVILMICFKCADVWMNNLLIFLFSSFFSIIISFLIDFIVGIMVFYTHSTWGINIMKTMIISLCSGAMIPLDFFPTSLNKVLSFLPFRCIYDIPIKLLILNNLSIFDYLELFCYQFFWIAILLFISNRAWKKARRVVLINGG